MRQLPIPATRTSDHASRTAVGATGQATGLHAQNQNAVHTQMRGRFSTFASSHLPFPQPPLPQGSEPAQQDVAQLAALIYHASSWRRGGSYLLCRCPQDRCRGSLLCHRGWAAWAWVWGCSCHMVMGCTRARVSWSCWGLVTCCTRATATLHSKRATGSLQAAGYSTRAREGKQFLPCMHGPSSDCCRQQTHHTTVHASMRKTARQMAL